MEKCNRKIRSSIPTSITVRIFTLNLTYKCTSLNFHFKIILFLTLSGSVVFVTKNQNS